MLKYVGNGDFVPGVPARDLSDEEAKEFDEKTLLASGLYVKVPDKKAPEKAREA